MNGGHDAKQRQLMATVAWLYHTRGLTQTAIARRLNISQSRVSRLLDQAVTAGIARTVVVLPKTEQSILEEELERAYGLAEAHVFDLGRVDSESQLVQELGQLLALYFQNSPLDGDVVGFTSWSRTLQETVRNLEAVRNSHVQFVVEMLGDLGPPQLQHAAAQVTQRLADITSAVPMFLRIPGVSPSARVKRTMLEHNPFARDVLAMLDNLGTALIGIGTGEIVAPLQGGDNFFTAEQFASARALGAVGELNLRFIDVNGDPVVTPLDDLVVGATLDQLRRAERRIGVAGGPSKYRAIRAALRGGWINCFLTDSATAEYLLNDS